MPLNHGYLLITVAALVTSSELLAQAVTHRLSNNPFSRPLSLNLETGDEDDLSSHDFAAEDAVLDLTATLVSDTAPMVVAEGELIAVGETIAGFILISVSEGKATFLRGGKKFSFMIGEQQPTE